MAKKYKGIEHIKGDSYRIDFQVNKKRIQCRIQADSLKEARIVREERIVELRREMKMPKKEKLLFNASFEEAWEKLESDLLADKVSKKNMDRHKRTFWRMFGEFRELKFSHVTNVSKVTLSFLMGYKAYFVNELGLSPNGGLRSELICVKSMLRRLRRLGFCGKDIIEDLKDIRRPKANKKVYPNVPSSKIVELLNFIKNDRPDYYSLTYFICRTGRRINETSLIQRTDVEWVGLNPVKVNIRAETTKSKEDAPLQRLDEDLRRVIREANSRAVKHNANYLFCNRLGKKCSHTRILIYLKDISREITGVELTPHYFRHRFLTECGKANVPITDFMHIAGIKDLKVVTKYYTHSTKDGQDKVLAVSRI